MLKNIDRGFSLLELISVLLIAAVLAISVFSTSSLSSSSVSETKLMILKSLRHCREFALTQAETNSSVQFIVSSTFIDVRKDGLSMQYPNTEYPLTIPSGITLMPNSIVANFDMLGRTQDFSLEISDGLIVEIISVSGSGYAF